MKIKVKRYTAMLNTMSHTARRSFLQNLRHNTKYSNTKEQQHKSVTTQKCNNTEAP
jgi:hypothetical protein